MTHPAPAEGQVWVHKRHRRREIILGPVEHGRVVDVIRMTSARRQGMTVHTLLREYRYVGELA